MDLKVETGMYTVSIGLLWGMSGVMKSLTKTYASKLLGKRLVGKGLLGKMINPGS